MSNSQFTKDPMRDDILNGARELFERFGFKKTTMEDIARQIGKSKSALYYYYKTKEEIFEAVVLHDMETTQGMMIEAVNKENSAYKRFQVYIETLGTIKQKSSKFLFKSELYENRILFENSVRKRDVYIEEMLKDMLILGISQQEVRMMNNAEIGQWATLINTAVKGIAHRIFLEDDFNLSESQLRFMADLLFNGVKA